MKTHAIPLSELGYQRLKRLARLSSQSKRGLLESEIVRICGGSHPVACIHGGNCGRPFVWRGRRRCGHAH